MSPFYFMKRILFVLSMLVGVAYGQSIGYWRYDTVVLQKIGGNSELKVMNATRAVTGGVLTNMGNGRTAFVTPSVTGRDRFGFPAEDVRATAARYFSFGSQSFNLDSIGNASRFMQKTNTSAFKFDITQTSGTDSVYLYLQKDLFSTARRVGIGAMNGTTHREARVNVGLSAGLPQVLIQSTSATTSSDINIRLDSTGVNLYAQDVNSHRTLIRAEPDSIVNYVYDGGDPTVATYFNLYRQSIYGSTNGSMIFGAGTHADQYADDSLVWRTTDRHSSLTLNIAGWHAWEDDGDYWFYNTERITDTTGQDVMVLSRSGEKMRKIPAGIFGGGGSQGLQDVIAVDPVLTTNNSIDVGSNDLIIYNGALDLLYANGASGNSGLGGNTITLQAENYISLSADSISANASPFYGNSNKYNDQTGTTYTLLSSDNGKILTISNGSAITLTVPASLPAGFNCTIIQKGAGQITFTASSTTINNRQSFTKTKGQYSMVTIVQYGTNLFITQGDME